MRTFYLLMSTWMGIAIIVLATLLELTIFSGILLVLGWQLGGDLWWLGLLSCIGAGILVSRTWDFLGHARQQGKAILDINKLLRENG